jgi:hypothetical protein
VRRPQRDIAGEGFEEHEIFSSAAEGYSLISGLILHWYWIVAG